MVVGAVVATPGASAIGSVLSSGATATAPGERIRTPARRIDLAFVGDIHTLRRVNYSAQRPNGGWDFSPMFAAVAPLLRSFDTAVCHMEAPIAPPGTSVIVVPPVLSTAAPMASRISDGSARAT